MNKQSYIVLHLGHYERKENWYITNYKRNALKRENYNIHGRPEV